MNLFQASEKRALHYGPSPMHDLLEKIKINAIEVSIGRIELEEFGMVNLDTQLNKSRKGIIANIGLKDNGLLWEGIQRVKNRLLEEGAFKQNIKDAYNTS